MANVQKYILEEKIRLLHAKHRGDVLAIAEESNLPVEYIKKIAGKIKKRCSRDVSYLISQTLMEHILEGYKQRTFLLVESLKEIDSSSPKGAKLRLDTIEALRLEDEALVSFAEKMGYTNRKEVPTQKIEQNILYIPNGSKRDNDMASEIASLPPREREKIRKELERKIGGLGSIEDLGE